MAWDKTKPPAGGALLSAEIRDNWNALDAAVMAALAAGPTHALMTIAVGGVVGKINAVASGAVLASAGAATTPVWTTAPTLTGNLTISKASPALVLDKAASGQNAEISGLTAGIVRWLVVLGDGTSETGGNVGSNFGVYAFSDTGTYLSTPIQVVRGEAISPVQILTGGIYRTIQTGAADSGGAGYRMLRVAN